MNSVKLHAESGACCLFASGHNFKSTQNSGRTVNLIGMYRNEFTRRNYKPYGIKVTGFFENPPSSWAYWRRDFAWHSIGAKPTQDEKTLREREIGRLGLFDQILRRDFRETVENLQVLADGDTAGRFSLPGSGRS